MTDRNEQGQLFTITGEEREALKARILEAEKERRIMVEAAKDVAAPYKERAKKLDAKVSVLLRDLGETAEVKAKWLAEARETADRTKDEDERPARPTSVKLAGDALARAAAEEAASRQGKRKA